MNDSGPTVLLAPHQTIGELGAALQRTGARVLAWPTLDVGPPDSFQALDEAIENLFGYDWLIFPISDSVEFFVQRFLKQGHEISELDNLRVCAIGEETTSSLAESQIHNDVIADRGTQQSGLTPLEIYVGGREALQALNFLIPMAANARHDLSTVLEASGARVDSVTAYQTVSANDSSLARISALLAGGGVDGIVFTAADELRQLARLFGANDLSQVLADTAVVCAGLSALKAAADFGLHTDFTGADRNSRALAEAIYRYLSK
jgi:uroporphyrinogen III methyltransferase/synthase